MITAGIDAGSRALKIVLWDGEAGRDIASTVADQGVRQAEAAETNYRRLLSEQGLSPGDVARIVATGYGRNIVPFADTTVTEITCHARGVVERRPDVATVIDIGGQDSKVIHLDGGGRVRDFAMNDRCAAGTGRFLEVVAGRLEVDLDRLGELASRSATPAEISSMCVVFAETEIIGLLAAGAAPEDIVAGVMASIAGRVASMAGRGVTEPVVFTGGVARLAGMREALETVIERRVTVCDTPQLTGALGAAILAAKRS